MTTQADDLPERTVNLAAMINASTVASAALGRNIESARIIRDLEIERGGRPDASVWFEPGLKLPVVWCGAHECTDERCGGIRRQ